MIAQLQIKSLHLGLNCKTQVFIFQNVVSKIELL